MRELNTSELMAASGGGLSDGLVTGAIGATVGAGLGCAPVLYLLLLV